MCSKGTSIRSIAHDMGQLLGCGSHLTHLTRTRSGQIHLADCFEGINTSTPNLETLTAKLQPQH